MRVDEILETCLYVDDLNAAEQFYRDVLGLQLHSRLDGRHVFFRCGNQMLLIFNPHESSQPGGDLPLHGATGPGHVAFAVRETELDLWRRQLAAANVAVEQEIEWPQGGRSICFRDPAGNSLEFATPRIWNIESHR